MTSIFLRDGKILIASGGRGFSQDCGCCDNPPPPPPGGCDSCCAGDQGLDDSVLISLECTLPSVSVQAFSPSPSDNGLRVVPGVDVAGEGVIYVTTVDQPLPFMRAQIRCLGAFRGSSWIYSNTTFFETIGIDIDLAHPFDADGGWSPFTPVRCEANVTDLQLGSSFVDLKPGGGSNALLELEADPDTGAYQIFYSFYSEPVALQDSGPCAGSPVVFPLYYSGAATNFGDVIGEPERGTEVGSLTINDVE